MLKLNKISAVADKMERMKNSGHHLWMDPKFDIEMATDQRVAVEV